MLRQALVVVAVLCASTVNLLHAEPAYPKLNSQNSSNAAYNYKRDFNPPYFSLEFIGEAQIPSGTKFNGTVIGGLSGIDFNPITQSYVALSDDRDEPRFYDLNIDLSDGVLSDGDISITKVTTILDKDGGNFSEQPDPEGIRVAPLPGLLYWTSERLGNDNTPFTRVMNGNGEYLVGFDLPEKFVAVDDVSGTRSNVGLESITFGKNTRRLFVANESALVQDGEKSNLTTASPTRVLRLNARTGKVKKEYIYMVDPIADTPIPVDAFADSGLVELLALSKDTFIALERSFSVGALNPYTVKLYLTSTRRASNVKRFHSIKGRRIRSMKKHLLFNLAELGIPLDNIEGITFGPKVDGQKTLILVSDDNFSEYGPQFNQFIAFKILPASS